eukprot:1181938-Prorocentrum_minimum.AAC.2
MDQVHKDFSLFTTPVKYGMWTKIPLPRPLQAHVDQDPASPSSSDVVARGAGGLSASDPREPQPSLTGDQSWDRAYDYRETILDDDDRDALKATIKGIAADNRAMKSQLTDLRTTTVETSFAEVWDD